ncbi:DUF397 domain-containing protein [Nocardiopsis sp. CNS-639]|uniref:DUF397 domain-containing protein n=1 Tax=Nocardiopsis sp. CNS-639 TaxID=1169153 RepID=UPI000361575F|nr:DUF397 domain-containing protein [Nocardiopsis sp. CNS-639]
MRPDWHKSTYSTAAENCVEVREGAVTGIRDTQNRDLGHLAVPVLEWAAVLAVTKGRNLS